MGHKVSHSNHQDQAALPAQSGQCHLQSDALARNVRLRISTNALKTVDHRGGLDAFLVKAKADELSPKALKLKRELEKKLAAAS